MVIVNGKWGPFSTGACTASGFSHSPCRPPMDGKHNVPIVESPFGLRDLDDTSKRHTDGPCALNGKL